MTGVNQALQKVHCIFEMGTGSTLCICHCHDGLSYCCQSHEKVIILSQKINDLGQQPAEAMLQPFQG